MSAGLMSAVDAAEATDSPIRGAAVSVADPPGAQLAGLVRGSRGQALGLATLGFFGGFAGVSIFGPLVPKFAGLLGLSPLAAALLAAMPNLTGSLLRIPFGAAVDRLGGKRPFLVLLLVTNAGVLGLLGLLIARFPGRMAGTYPLLLALGALIGCGIAAFSVGIGQVSYWYSNRAQGGALGTYAGLGNTSPGLSSMLLPLAVGSVGMLGAYSVWFAVLLLITICYTLIHDAPWFQLTGRGINVAEDALDVLGGGDRRPHGAALAGLRHAARVPATWALVFFYFLSFGGFLAFTAWLPAFWHHMYGAGLREGGLLTAGFSLISALVRVPGGLLADRVSIKYALHGNFVLMLAGVLVLSWSGTFELSLLATIAVAIGMGLQNAIVFKLLPHYVPGAIGGASGWVGGLGALGGFVLPPVIGVVSGAVGGAAGYARGFLPVAVLIATALPVVAWLNRWATREAPGFENATA